MTKIHTAYTTIALFLALVAPAAAQESHTHGEPQNSQGGATQGSPTSDPGMEQGPMMQNMMRMMMQMHQKMMGQGGMHGMNMEPSTNGGQRGQMEGMGTGPMGRMDMMDSDMMELMSRRHAGSASPSGDLSETMSMHMKQFDANGDDTLSLAEFEALHSALMRETMVDRFQHLDADGDGKITVEEMKEAAGRMK